MSRAVCSDVVQALIDLVQHPDVFFDVEALGIKACLE